VVFHVTSSTTFPHQSVLCVTPLLACLDILPILTSFLTLIFHINCEVSSCILTLLHLHRRFPVIYIYIHIHTHTHTFLWRCGPVRAMASSFLRFLDHIPTHYSRKDSSGQVISSSQRPLQQHTTLRAPSGIRTQNPSKRAATDLSLRPRGHWDRT
jgi:Fe2+ transport system protein B